MCGRTACTLNPDQISRATRYRNSKGRDVNPKWRGNDAGKYRPSYNKAPMSYCPVLMHARHLDKDSNSDENDASEEDCAEHERVIAAMKWGLVPTWVKDASQAQYKMNNARSDTMLTKTSYKLPLEKGQRCVVLANGFYEWNTTKSEKQPYYIFFKDSETYGAKVKDEASSDGGKDRNDNSETKECVITMAGIFERRKSEDPEEDDLFTFSVITVDAHPAFGWLHHRMPAMLESADDVNRWLDSGSVPLNEAVELIRPRDCLSWYPVSKLVNNSRNNVPECMEKIDLTETKTSSESKGLAKWLAKSKDANKTTQESLFKKTTIKTETTSPGKGLKSPKKGQKRPSSGPKDGWVKKAKKENSDA